MTSQCFSWVQVSRLYLVDMPGSERLLVDPELLRQREGSQLNQSLLSFAVALRKLAQGTPAHAINYNASILTKLLSGQLLPIAMLILIQCQDRVQNLVSMRCKMAQVKFVG